MAEDTKLQFILESMSPNGGGEPSGNLAEAIKNNFDSFEKFKSEFSKAAQQDLVLDGLGCVKENGLYVAQLLTKIIL